MQEKVFSLKSGIKLVFCILPLFFLLCGRSDRVLLSIDLSKASSWRYLLGVDLKGNVSSQLFNSSLRTYLLGGSQKRGLVTFTTEQPRITSDFLSDQERSNLEQQFEKMTLSFSPVEGAIDLPDTEFVPVINVGEWDLFRSFTKVLPVFPQISVAPGDHWERERQFPLETTHGSAMGHLYQSFTFDSLYSAECRYASVSWLFSYRIQLVDTSVILEKLPRTGNGRGQVLLDLDKKRISKAHAFFEVPGQKTAQGIGWSETVHMELVE